VRASGAILQGAGPVGYYLKVLKGVLLLDPRFWAFPRRFVLGRFVLGRFVLGRFVPGFSSLGPRS
jgi:hypothetical protein